MTYSDLDTIPPEWTAGLTADDKRLLEQAAAEESSFFRLYIAGEGRPNHSPSETDFEMGCMWARHTRDVEQIKRLMESSPLARTGDGRDAKWSRHRSYLARTIATALARENEFQFIAREAKRNGRVGAGALEEATPQGPTYQLLDDTEIETAPDPTWLLDGLVQADTYIVLYGDSSGGKTFLALDWSLCVATGMPWRGRPVKQGPVIYIGAEGRSGFKRRVHAWKVARSYVGRAGVQFINATANVREAKTAEQLLSDIRAKLGETQPALIWLDTLNRHLAGGDENSSKDIGLANMTANALREATGATVGYVHHCRRADEQERGHFSLRNAADTMMWLGVTDDGETRELKCTKQREADEFAPLTFRMRPEGDSLVIDDPVVRESGALAVTDRQALEALWSIYTGAPVPAGQWLTVSKQSERTFYRVRARLVKHGHVTQPEKRGGFVPVTAPATACHPLTGDWQLAAVPAGGSKGGSRAGSSGGSSVAGGSSDEDALPF